MDDVQINRVAKELLKPICLVVAGRWAVSCSTWARRVWIAWDWLCGEAHINYSSKCQSFKSLIYTFPHQRLNLPINSWVNKRDSVSEAPQLQRSSTSPEQSQNNSGNSPTCRHRSLAQDILIGDSKSQPRTKETTDQNFHNHTGTINGRPTMSHNGKLFNIYYSRRQSQKRIVLLIDPSDYPSANLFTNTLVAAVLETQSIVYLFFSYVYSIHWLQSSRNNGLNSHSYYFFLKLGSMSKLSSQDVNFLKSQACFWVPTRTVVDEFVWEYFLHIQPILPILNGSTFWTI